MGKLSPNLTKKNKKGHARPPKQFSDVKVNTVSKSLGKTYNKPTGKMDEPMRSQAQKMKMMKKGK